MTFLIRSTFILQKKCNDRDKNSMLSGDTQRVFDVNMIIQAIMEGTRANAEELFASTIRYALPIFHIDDIVRLHKAGLEKQATELYAKTSPDAPHKFPIDDIARLCSSGMEDMASDLYSQTVEFVKMRHHFPVAQIVKMYSLGLTAVKIHSSQGPGSHYGNSARVAAGESSTIVAPRGRPGPSRSS